MKRSIFLWLFFLFLGNSISAQKLCVKWGNKNRYYILHLPLEYNAEFVYPLILNFHGLNSNAEQQQYYTRFDSIADTAKFIVVYPQGLNNNWNITGMGKPDDFGFIKSLIDTLRTRYSIDTASIFSTGMSMGGFMTYVLACHFPNMLAAIAPVAGNMVVTTQANCPMEKGIPLLEIHGTNDYIVAYKGTFFITPVTKTVAWWAKQSGCDSLLKDTDLPNFNTEDKCEIKKTVYLNPKNKVEVVHYCIKGGGHTWPGAPAIKILGKTCYDMNASAVIWSFFSKYCSSKATSIKK